MLPRPVVVGIAILVSIFWAANLVVGVIDPGRSDPYVNGIFAIVVGAIFSSLGRGGTASARRKMARLLDPERPSENSDDDRGGQS